jgi:peptidoglycan/xylan/chitin deacetylase (PgdA/CDA1 family)
MQVLAIKNVGEVLAAVPLGIYQTIIRRKHIGFFYHVVSDHPLPHTRHLYPHRPIEEFERDVIYQKKHYTILPYPELERVVQHDEDRQYASLSFDDGFSECFTIVRPILLRHQIPCTFFVATDFIENRAMYFRNKISLLVDRFLSMEPPVAEQAMIQVNQEYNLGVFDRVSFISWLKSVTEEPIIDRICSVFGVDISGYLKGHTPYLTEEQIRKLVSDGFTIGAHSKSHRKLGRLTPVEVEAEILDSCQRVREITGQDRIPFSFPNSAEGLDREFLKSLRVKHRYLGLFFDTKGFRQDREFILNRIWVEAPKYNLDGVPPLPVILRRAYTEYSVKALNTKRAMVLHRRPESVSNKPESIESSTLFD